MNTKAVYVLTSTPKDIYLEQFYISALSLRKYNKICNIILMVDSTTKKTFVGFREEMSKIADSIIVVNIPDYYTNKEKSRLLKTSVREHIDGDFLFIDCDTIIVKPLDDIDNLSIEIAACMDSHSNFLENPYRKMCLDHGHKLGWPIDEERVYFNSGIIYVKDTLMTHKFYQLWNKNYKEGTRIGVTMDQPSFAKTNYQLGHIVKTLPEEWNCELKHGITCFNTAKIIHYLCTNINQPGDKQVFILHDRKIFDKLKKSESMPLEITRCINDWTSGIQSPTQIISGYDLEITKSRTYVILRKFYKTKIFNFIENSITTFSKIKSKFK